MIILEWVSLSKFFNMIVFKGIFLGVMSKGRFFLSMIDAFLEIKFFLKLCVILVIMFMFVGMIVILWIL